MANTNRQIYGMSSEEPLVQIAIPVQQQMGNINTQKVPFEIDYYKQRIFEIFEKVMILRNQFDAASNNNPSVTESQKIALDRSVKRLDKINEKLIEVPDFLSVFDVD